MLNTDTLNNPEANDIYTGDDLVVENNFLSQFSGLEKTAYAIKLQAYKYLYGARRYTKYDEDNKSQYKRCYAKLAPKPIKALDPTNLDLYLALMTGGLQNYSFGGTQLDQATGYIRPQAAAVELLIEACEAEERRNREYIY